VFGEQAHGSRQLNRKKLTHKELRQGKAVHRLALATFNDTAYL
jgi:hypothetical protein